MEHLNSGNGSIIPDIDGINKTCPLRFTTKSFDTECQQIVGLDHVVSLTDRIKAAEEQQLFPTAILGASYSSISMPTAMISGLRHVPQISPGSTSVVLDNKEQYKLFGRTIPNDDGTSIPLIEKLLSWNVNHLAILYVDNSYGIAFMEGIILAAQQYAPNLRIQTVSMIANPSASRIRSAIQRLRETQYTYFFGILYSANIEAIMTEAYDQGIAGRGKHNWIFSDGMGGYLSDRQYETGSKLALAFYGTGVLTASGGIPGMENFDKLDQAIQGMKNNEDISYLETLFPTDYADGKVVNHTVISRSDDFLSTPEFATPFLYDAIIALGLAACELRSIGDASFTGEELFETFKDTTFEGTSGSVEFDNVTGSRDPRSAVFVLENYVYENDIAYSGMIQFKRVESDVFIGGKWDSLVPYIFSDGTDDVPADLPPLETDHNYASTGVKVIGCIFYLVILVLSISFGVWTYTHRNKHVVR